jgi:hypothetical protein
VATLLTLVYDPGTVTERPPLRELMSEIDRDGLIDIIPNLQRKPSAAQ